MTGPGAFAHEVAHAGEVVEPELAPVPAPAADTQPTDSGRALQRRTAAPVCFAAGPGHAVGRLVVRGDYDRLVARAPAGSASRLRALLGTSEHSTSAAPTRRWAAAIARGPGSPSPCSGVQPSRTGAVGLAVRRHELTPTEGLGIRRGQVTRAANSHRAKRVSSRKPESTTFLPCATALDPERRPPHSWLATHGATHRSPGLCGADRDSIAC